MTVKELIEKLQEADPNLVVTVWSMNGDCSTNAMDTLEITEKNELLIF